MLSGINDNSVQRTALPGSIPLYTRLGREIPNAQDPDPGPNQVERFRTQMRRRYPKAQERRPPTGQYNCHGMTFANRRTGIHRPEYVAKILEDDGYKPIILGQVEPGDLVLYSDGGEIEHTGVVLEVVEGFPEGSGIRAPRIISKWGPTGEYIHLATEGPYKGHIEYRTDRP